MATRIQIDESQNTEFKESWRDEYLGWICGFANAQGGRIYIGVNDDHEIVGVRNSKQLMEDIPNKIVTHLGIVADVNLLSEEGLDYVEIIVEPVICLSATTVTTITAVAQPSYKLIARVFYLAGYIEAWGRDYAKIRENFERAKLEMPEFSIVRNGVMARVKREFFASMQINSESGGEINGEISGEILLTDRQRVVLNFPHEQYFLLFRGELNN